MKIYLGKTGLEHSWQELFKEIVDCKFCAVGKAKIMFVAYERDEKEYVCDLYKTTGEEGGLWFHDAISLASYLCPNCFEVTSLVNQA